MKNGMKFLPMALLMLVFSITTLSAQKSTYSTSTHERTPGYWTFGLNGGLAYQTSDVPFTTDGWGAGLTLAKNLYYRPGSTFAFDLRGRLLYAESYGLDHERSYGITRNPVLNGMEGLNYTKANNEAGFVFQNNRTHFGEIGLEGVLHFNKLRERTNINLSLFGGVGIGGYWARTDQADDDGNLYSAGYLGIDTTASRSVIRRQLKEVLDGYEETDALGDDFGGIGFMPGAGIELGYQLTPRFSLGLGHKVTFTRTDDFDGVKYDHQNNLSTDNDWHHYTNLNLRWIIDPKKDKQKGPDVDIINPQRSTTTIYQSSAFIRASIKHVNNAMDIDLTVNGKSTPFDYNGGILKSEFELLEGRNKVTVSAFNAAGSDSETVTIIYVDRFKEKDPVIENNPRVETPEVNDPIIEDDPVVETPLTPYPVVKITRPYRNSETVEEDRYRVKATIENVDYKDDVYFTVNGRRQDNFSLRGTRFESDIYLVEGNNRIKIEARNQRGTRSDQANIKLEEMVKLVKPLVNITKPYRDPYTTKNSRERIEATVGPLDNNCNILFKVNGRSISGFDYRGDRFTGNADLKVGRNEIEIVAANDAGTSSDRTIIYYELEQQIEVPKVDITTPRKSRSRTDKDRIEVKATTDNISSKSGIDFIVNGQKKYDFDFDSRTGRIRGFVTLEKGNNQIEIAVRNQDGSDQDRVDVEYYVVVTPPRVKISKPRNRTKVDNPKIAFTGSVSNVDRKDQVELFLNGKRVSNFGYSNGRVSANLTLAKGKNQIVLKARNEGGRDEASVNVTYEMPTIKIAKPKVNFTVPSKNITTKKTSYQVTVKVENVMEKDKMDLKVNGKSVSFNFDRRRKIIKATVKLKEGTNKLIAAARNDSGTASDEVSIRKESDKPGKVTGTPGQIGTIKVAKPAIDVFTMSQPSVDPFNPNTAKTRIVASLKNVKSKTEITLTVNGTRITNFNFNASSGRLEVIHTINRGTHTAVLKLKTKGGQAQKTTSITF